MSCISPSQDVEISMVPWCVIVSAPSVVLDDTLSRLHSLGEGAFDALHPLLYTERGPLGGLIMGSHFTLAAFLEEHTMPAAPGLVREEHDALRCLSCANRCLIADGKRGICMVRFNRNGELRVPYGYVSGLNVDPIEKKPFYHAYPGRDALSFGMLSCNFHCPFCQNWVSSQGLRDTISMGLPHVCEPDELVSAAVERGAPMVVSTYNEPLVTADWAAKVFEKAIEAGLRCGYVSNGYATPEVLEFLKPYVTLYNVDLKCFDEDHYRMLGGSLKDVCATIERIKELGVWVEVITLVVPDFNDSDAELRHIAQFIAGLSV
ncbi:MAG TPA: radical SAM protein, partial [Candidatus Hydrogenedentes bacterium]|nr:radical SAM protein [Candidatus Hydrogenedentota bacterium]